MIGNLKKGQAVFLLLAALLALGPGAAPAEEAAGRLTLQQAMDIALKEHPSLKESKEKVTAAKYQIGASPGRVPAASDPTPTISITGILSPPPPARQAPAVLPA